MYTNKNSCQLDVSHLGQKTSARRILGYKILTAFLFSHIVSRPGTTRNQDSTFHCNSSYTLVNNSKATQNLRMVCISNICTKNYKGPVKTKTFKKYRVNKVTNVMHKCMKSLFPLDCHIKGHSSFISV